MITETFGAPVILEDYRESGTAKGPHLAKIAGTFNREGAQSRNRRTYSGIERWIADGQARIEQGQTLSMFTSHESAQTDATLQKFGKLTRVHVDGDAAKFEGLIANTSVGRDVLTLLEGGYATSISQRLAGPIEHETLKAEASPDGKGGWEVITYGVLQGIDITDSPGIPDATMYRAESGVDGYALAETFPLEPDTDPAYWERDFSADQRDKAASSGAAMPGGSFPILTQKDLENAIHAIGRAKDPEAAKAHIKKRAAALGLTNLLPDDWKESTPSALVAESPPATMQGDGIMPDEPTTEATPDLNDARHALADAMDAHVEGKRPLEPAVAESLKAADDRAAALEAKLMELTARLDSTTIAPTSFVSTDALHPEAGVAAAAVGESAEEEDPDVTEAVASITDALAVLSEAGRAISTANMTKLQAAHDALNDAANTNGGSMLCPDPDKDGESHSEPAGINESAVQAMVAQAVQTAAAQLAETNEATIAAKFAERDKARRKSHAVAEAQSDEPSIEDRLAKMTPDERLRFAINHDLGIPTTT